MISVIIPSRNEVYLEQTVRSILEAAEGEIEILVMLDGYKPDPRIHIEDDRVIFHHFEESIGQRPAINEGARRAKGKYILKTDAHSMFDKGFDVKLAADCEYDWTVIPRMYNLDVEKWEPKKRKVTDYMWIRSPHIGDRPFRAYYFDGTCKREEPELYARHKAWAKKQPEIADVMTGQGACWFMHKDRFWELGGLDEEHGQWGQMGIEMAMKAWLSGGRHVVNKKTWFSHYFRGGKSGPGFPWPASGKAHERARKYSTDLWINEKWPLQKRPLQWLIDKFEGQHNWNDITVVHLSANKETEKVEEKAQKELVKSANGKPIVSVTQKPIDIGENIVVGDVGYSGHNYLRQLLIGAEKATTKYIAVAESDCLYPPDHFNYKPEDGTICFNENVYYLRSEFRKKKKPSQCSMIGDRLKIIEEIKSRLEGRPEWVTVLEHGKARIPSLMDDGKFFSTANSVINIYHKYNMNKHKVSTVGDPVRMLPYWGCVEDLFMSGGEQYQYKKVFSTGTDRVDKMFNNVAYYGPRKISKDSDCGFYAFYSVFPDFIKQVADGGSMETLSEHPYYDYLYRALNRKIAGTKRGRKHVLRKMQDAINLYHDIKDNGMTTPIDLYKYEGRRIIERGNRRIVIAKQLGWGGIPIRVFIDRESFFKRKQTLDVRNGGVIETAAIKRFCKKRWRSSDKYYTHNYPHLYDDRLKGLYHKRHKILEIGAKKGYSLDLWQKSFPNATIYGVDIDPKCADLKHNIMIGDQREVGFLRKVADEGPYNLIVDDGSHYPKDILASFEVLWDSVASGGYYVIEDLWHSYKYRKDRPMIINRLKELIDKIPTERLLEVSFYPNIVFIRKA